MWVAYKPANYGYQKHQEDSRTEKSCLGKEGEPGRPGFGRLAEEDGLLVVVGGIKHGLGAESDASQRGAFKFCESPTPFVKTRGEE